MGAEEKFYAQMHYLLKISFEKFFTQNASNNEVLFFFLIKLSQYAILILFPLLRNHPCLGVEVFMKNQCMNNMI